MGFVVVVVILCVYFVVCVFFGVVVGDIVYNIVDENFIFVLMMSTFKEY